MENTWPVVYLKEKKPNRNNTSKSVYFFKFSADRPKIISLQLQTGENSSFLCLEAAGENPEREAGCHGLNLVA